MSFRRNRRALQLRPVNSLKHVIDTSGVVIGGTVATTDVAIQTDNPVTTGTNQIHIGGHIKAIFLSVQVKGSVAYAGTPRVYFIVWKNPGNQIIQPVVDAVGVSTRRKFVIHQEMMMVDDVGPAAASASSFPRSMFKGVILLPKRYQRFGDADRLTFTIGNAAGESTGQTDWCIQCIYKEFF